MTRPVHLDLTIPELACPHCANRMIQTVVEVRGVREVIVDTDAGEARLLLEGAKCVQTLIESLDRAGLRVGTRISTSAKR